jgi:hypothetical protein
VVFQKFDHFCQAHSFSQIFQSVKIAPIHQCFGFVPSIAIFAKQITPKFAEPFHHLGTIAFFLRFFLINVNPLNPLLYFNCFKIIFFEQNKLLAFWVKNLSHDSELSPSPINLLLKLGSDSFLKGLRFNLLQSPKFLFVSLRLTYPINFSFLFNELACMTVILWVERKQSGTRIILNLCEYNLITVKLKKILDNL